MSRASRLGKNTVLVFIGKLGSSIIGFLMLPLYTRWLGVEVFGVSDLITVYSTLLLTLVTFCISESIFIFPKDKDKWIQSAYFSSALFFLVGIFLIAALIFGFIQIFSKLLYIDNTFINNIWYIYLLLVTHAIQQFFQQFTRSIDKILVFSITGLVNTVCIAIFAFILIPPMGLAGYVLSQALAALLSGMYSFVASKAYTYIDVKDTSRKLLGVMLNYSIPLMPNGIMWWLVSSLNRPLMELHLGMHEIGIYAVANKFPAILTLVFGIFSTSWQISVLEEFGKNSYKDFYNKVFKVVFSLLLIILLIITLSSKLIVELFASKDFYEAWHYIPLLTLGALLSNVSSFVGTNFSATRKSKYYFYSSIWGAVSSAFFNILLIPLFGTYGVCVAFILSFATMAVSRLCYSWKYVKIHNIFQYLAWMLITIAMIVLYISEISYLYVVGTVILILLSIFYGNRDSLYIVIKFVKSTNKLL